MAEFIVEELYVFLVMIAIGAAMSATYDVLRIIRRAVRHSVAVTSCEDVLYWIIWAFSAYRIFLFINDVGPASCLSRDSIIPGMS